MMLQSKLSSRLLLLVAAAGILSLAGCKKDPVAVAGKQFVNLLNTAGNDDRYLYGEKDQSDLGVLGYRMGYAAGPQRDCGWRFRTDSARADELEQQSAAATGDAVNLAAMVASELRDCLQVECVDQQEVTLALLGFVKSKGARFELGDVVVGKGPGLGPTMAQQDVFYGGKQRATVAVRLPAASFGKDAEVLFQFEEFETEVIQGMKDQEIRRVWFPTFGGAGYTVDNLWCAMPPLRRWAVANGFKPPQKPEPVKIQPTGGF